MMNYSYYLHPLADKDYAEAYAWYEDKEEGLGERFIVAVRKKIEAIISNPEVYGSKGKKEFREAMVEGFPYIIVYKLRKRKEQIFISSIHHAKKHPKHKYRKEP
jgi:plasmid stabilization system protein ParE